MIGSIAWYALHWKSSGLSAASIALRVLGWSFLGGTAGKIVGIVLAGVRARRNRLARQATISADENLAGSAGGSIRSGAA
ncbi:MAG: hypothetical protein WB992_07620 [Bryobacteraceae bacterium]